MHPAYHLSFQKNELFTNRDDREFTFKFQIVYIFCLNISMQMEWMPSLIIVHDSDPQDESQQKLEPCI